MAFNDAALERALRAETKGGLTLCGGVSELTVIGCGWMSCFNPTQEDVNRMSDEVRNIRESVNSKNLNIWEVRDAIKDEFGWET